MSTYPIHHAPAFPELPEAYRLISFTGAGGKTTLIQWLACSARAAMLRTIVTTTTKIFPPIGERIVLEGDGPDFLNRVHNGLSEHSHLVVARRFDRGTGKLIGLRPETVTELHESGVADVILVEADGAARKPLKAPKATEPVIPQGTELCVAVMGLDAAYRPLDAVTVHRPDIFSRITHCPPGGMIHPGDMVRIATAPNGLFKGTPPDADLAVFLNKADSPDHQALVDRFESLLTYDVPDLTARWFAGSAQAHVASEITPYRFTMPYKKTTRLEFLQEF